MPWAPAKLFCLFIVFTSIPVYFLSSVIIIIDPEKQSILKGVTFLGIKSKLKPFLQFEDIYCLAVDGDFPIGNDYWNYRIIVITNDGKIEPLYREITDFTSALEVTQTTGGIIKIPVAYIKRDHYTLEVIKESMSLLLNFKDRDTGMIITQKPEIPQGLDLDSIDIRETSQLNKKLAALVIIGPILTFFLFVCIASFFM
ncbi:hypothetical protein ACFL35_21315 [Candidatus Riflebacteria bacterium]